jgi:NAD(P)-dependent dehydrogenase (short-subunit alcohol dehydrogenase family)
MKPLAGRVALVTGGSRGIGTAIARDLAAQGATVAISYASNRDAADQVAAEIDGSAWQADARDAEATQGLVEGVLERHGAIDVLVSNAGVWRGGWIQDISPEDWHTVLDTSLGGAFNVCRAAVPAMRARGFGRIVAVSSFVGLVGFPGDTPYASAKAGLFGFVRALAKEVGRDGITVNAVAPGPIRTDLTAEVSDDSWARMNRRSLLGREGTGEDVAKAVRYLACDGDWVTGHVLVVDGGVSL